MPSIDNNLKSNSVRLSAWFLAIVLYIIVPYPSSPVTFQIFGAYPREVYTILCLIGLMLVWSCPLRDSRDDSVKHLTTLFFLYVIGFAATFLATSNSMVIRDALLFCLLFYMIKRLSQNDFLNVCRCYILINLFCLTFAGIAVILFYTEVLDWKTWSAFSLNLNEANSASIRWDYDYYLPLRIALVAQSDVGDAGFGLNFVRQPFLYNEPSSTWHYTFGLFGIALADYKLPFRPLCIAVFGLALILSFSVFGILAVVFVYMIVLAHRFFDKRIILAVVLPILVVVIYNFNETLLQLVGGNKLEQYLLFSNNIDIFKNISMFGAVYELPENISYESYGALEVVSRYGVYGSLLYITTMAYLTVTSYRILVDSALPAFQRHAMSMAGFVTIFLALKDPSLVLAAPILITVFVYYLSSSTRLAV